MPSIEFNTHFSFPLPPDPQSSTVEDTKTKVELVKRTEHQSPSQQNVKKMTENNTHH